SETLTKRLSHHAVCNAPYTETGEIAVSRRRSCSGFEEFIGAPFRIGCSRHGPVPRGVPRQQSGFRGLESSGWTPSLGFLGNPTIPLGSLASPQKSSVGRG